MESWIRVPVRRPEAAMISTDQFRASLGSGVGHALSHKPAALKATLS